MAKKKASSKVKARAPRTRGKGPVEVVAFEEPHALFSASGSRKRARSSASSWRVDGDGDGDGAAAAAFEAQERKVREDVAAAWSDVMELGATKLGKRERKQHEALKLAELGCAMPKNPKVPIKILYSRERTLAKREAKRVAEVKAADLVTGAPADAKKKKRKTTGGSRKRRDDLHHWKDATMRGGVLRIHT